MHCSIMCLYDFVAVMVIPISFCIHSLNLGAFVGLLSSFPCNFLTTESELLYTIIIYALATKTGPSRVIVDDAVVALCRCSYFVDAVTWIYFGSCYTNDI